MVAAARYYSTFQVNTRAARPPKQAATRPTKTALSIACRKGPGLPSLTKLLLRPRGCLRRRRLCGSATRPLRKACSSRRASAGPATS
eukprot:scaffold33165_cov68-Phaeocystis_antarctica.AAC.1